MSLLCPPKENAEPSAWKKCLRGFKGWTKFILCILIVPPKIFPFSRRCHHYFWRNSRSLKIASIVAIYSPKICEESTPTPALIIHTKFRRVWPKNPLEKLNMCSFKYCTCDKCRKHFEPRTCVKINLLC